MWRLGDTLVIPEQEIYRCILNNSEQSECESEKQFSNIQHDTQNNRMEDYADFIQHNS